MGGPVYHYDKDLQSDSKWPEYFEGTQIFYEWSRSFLKDVKGNEDGALLQINPLFQGPGGCGFSQTMDRELGRYVSLYDV